MLEVDQDFKIQSMRQKTCFRYHIYKANQGLHFRINC